MNSIVIAIIVVTVIVAAYMAYTYGRDDPHMSEQMSASRHQESDAEGLSAME